MPRKESDGGIDGIPSKCSSIDGRARSTAKAESLTGSDDLVEVVTVPFGDKKDHAEGLSIVTRAPLSVLVSYDSPHPSRLDGADGSGVSADIFDVTL